METKTTTLVRCELYGRVCGDDGCLHGGLHEHRTICDVNHRGDECGPCVPVNVRKMWQAVNVDGARMGVVADNRSDVVRLTTKHANEPWRRIYRRGWRVVKVLVLDEE